MSCPATGLSNPFIFLWLLTWLFQCRFYALYSYFIIMHMPFGFSIRETALKETPCCLLIADVRESESIESPPDASFCALIAIQRCLRIEQVVANMGMGTTYSIRARSTVGVICLV